jgi:hypothetical protein
MHAASDRVRDDPGEAPAGRRTREPDTWRNNSSTCRADHLSIRERKIPFRSSGWPRFHAQAAHQAMKFGEGRSGSPHCGQFCAADCSAVSGNVTIWQPRAARGSFLASRVEPLAHRRHSVTTAAACPCRRDVCTSTARRFYTGAAARTLAPDRAALGPVRLSPMGAAARGPRVKSAAAPVM